MSEETKFRIQIEHIPTGRHWWSRDDLIGYDHRNHSIATHIETQSLGLGLRFDSTDGSVYIPPTILKDCTILHVESQMAPHIRDIRDIRDNRVAVKMSIS